MAQNILDLGRAGDAEKDDIALPRQLRGIGGLSGAAGGEVLDRFTIAVGHHRQGVALLHDVIRDAMAHQAEPECARPARVALICANLLEEFMTPKLSGSSGSEPIDRAAGDHKTRMRAACLSETGLKATFVCELIGRCHNCKLPLNRRRTAAFLNRSEKVKEKGPAELGGSARAASVTV